MFCIRTFVCTYTTNKVRLRLVVYVIKKPLLMTLSLGLIQAASFPFSFDDKSIGGSCGVCRYIYYNDDGKLLMVVALTDTVIMITSFGGGGK